MTLGLVKVLVKCGALPPKPSGPANPRSEEDAKRIKLEQQKAAMKRRTELIKAAKENEEPLPTFPRGRPRKYTPEEAKRMKATQSQGCVGSYNERVRQGIINLEALYGNRDESARSTDEHFFVAAN
jgi:hypothetical protein